MNTTLIRVLVASAGLFLSACDTAPTEQELQAASAPACSADVIARPEWALHLDDISIGGCPQGGVTFCRSKTTCTVVTGCTMPNGWLCVADCGGGDQFPAPAVRCE